LEQNTKQFNTMQLLNLFKGWRDMKMQCPGPPEDVM